jgi:hypothetical protein
MEEGLTREEGGKIRLLIEQARGATEMIEMAPIRGIIFQGGGQSTQIADMLRARIPQLIQLIQLPPTDWITVNAGMLNSPIPPLKRSIN